LFFLILNLGYFNVFIVCGNLLLEEENQKILDKLRLREFLEKNKDLEEKLKQTDLKQKHDKTITEVTLGGLRKDEEHESLLDICDQRHFVHKNCKSFWTSKPFDNLIIYYYLQLKEFQRQGGKG
jgi:hypothetical protein